MLEEITQNYSNETKIPIMMKKDINNKVITLYSTRPGILIGKYGATINKYKEELKDTYGYDLEIEECHELFNPGNNFADIVDARVKGYFELEGAE